MWKSVKWTTAAFAAMTLAACAKSGSNDNPPPRPSASGTAVTRPTPSPSNEPSNPPGTGSLTDGDIVEIVTTANTGEIDAARLAVGRSTNNDVKDFANQMISDHGDVNQQVTALAGKDNIQPRANTTGDKLAADGSALMAKLGGLHGADFDKAYIQSQVDAHTQVLGALDNDLIPGAQSPDLHDLLTQVRPKVAMHLEHAKKLAASLGQ